MMALSVLLSIVLTGCSSLRKSGGSTAKPSPRIERSNAVGNSAKVEVPSNAVPSMSALLKEANSWIGTPYKYGGNTREGVDCSGYVLQVYLRALDIGLPRTSVQQYDYCRRIGRDEMEPGDLMFFAVREGGSVGHVGIYIGDGRMIHASSKAGVVIAPVTTGYFAHNYIGCGRVDAYGKRLEAERNGAAKSNTSAPKPAEPRQQPKPQPTQPGGSPTPKVEQPIRTVRVTPKSEPAAGDIDDDFFD